MSRAGSFLRVASLLSAWVWIYIRMDDHPRLKEHLQYHSNLALLAISMGGTIMHVLCYVQQLYMGRWKFEDIDMQHSLYDKHAAAGNYKELQEVGDREAGGLYDTAASAPYLVAERWKMVHELLPEATSRVPRAEFISTHKKIATKSAAAHKSATGHRASWTLALARTDRTEYPADEQSAFHVFLTTLFTAATGLMLPKQKDDLGKHCYGYSSLVADEYYESPDLPPDNLGLLKAPAIGWFDPLKVLRVNLQDDWSHVQKDENQHVDLKGFKHVVTKRHFQKLGGIDEAAKAFETFLERIFEAVRLIGGRSDQQWIDQHGFIYGGLLAYEFYFADARDHEKAEGCGCSTPVADNLGITAALATKKA